MVLGFRVKGSGFRVKGLGFRGSEGPGLCAESFASRLLQSARSDPRLNLDWPWGLGIRVLGLGV